MKTILRIIPIIGCLFVSHGGFGYRLHIINDTLWSWDFDIRVVQSEERYDLFDAKGDITTRGQSGWDSDFNQSLGTIPPYSKGTITRETSEGDSSGECWKSAKATNRYKTTINLIKSKPPKRPISKCADVYIVIKPKGGKEDQFEVVRYDGLNPVYKGHWEDYWEKHKGKMADKKKELDSGKIWYRGRWVKPGT